MLTAVRIRRIARAAVLAALVPALAAASCGKKEEKAGSAQAPRGTPNVTISSYTKAPDVELKALDGTSVRLSSFDGKIVILTFMATWNKDCERQFAALDELQAKLQRYQFAVLGVVTDADGQAALQRFLAGKKFAYPIYYNGAEIAPKFGGVRRLPTTYIMLRDGSIYHKMLGYQSMREIDSVIKAIMAQRL